MASIWDNAFGQSTPTQSSPGTSNTFYQPGNGYGADRDWNSTPLVGQIRENAPSVAYSQYGQGIGIPDTDSSFNRWFYQQYPRFNQAYGMATLDNPLITIDEFLKTMPGINQLRGQFNQLSPGSRGLNWNSMAPQIRTIGRG